jgi:hypothetical protein
LIKPIAPDGAQIDQRHPEAAVKDAENRARRGNPQIRP